MKSSSWFLSALIVAFACKGQCQWPDTRLRSHGGIWPQPQHLKASNTTWKVDLQRLSFTIVPDGCEILVSAVQRLRKRLQNVFEAATQNWNDDLQDYMQSIVINVSGKCIDGEVPQLGMDEAYKLSTATRNSYLRAHEVWGALRGLESFAQLIHSPTGSSDIVIHAVKVRDFPRFPHRGVLLDTSRHYLSMNVLKANLELMSQNKFNTFHWHIVDSESFPYKSQAIPQLVQGAYTPNHIYTIPQVQEIIDYARLRGIRVIPEFDTPGHMKSWGVALPNLLARCFNLSGDEIDDRDLIDPTLSDNWDILFTLFKEVFEVFPDHYVHLGGDEVIFWTKNCWERNENITKFMKQHGLNGTLGLEKWYFNKLLGVLNGPEMDKKRKFLVWEEAMETEISVEGLIVHAWQDVAALAEATRRGYYCILSSCWYLNNINKDSDWETYYNCDPHEFNGTKEQEKLVLGGEAAMWGEWVDDSNSISRLWPRASAVAERLWSSKSVLKNDDTWPRLYEMQCRMAAQGYPVQPGWGPGFCDKEYQMQLPV